MKNLIFLFVFLIFACSSSEDANAQNEKDIFTIYLVRHSEKDLSANNPSDPPLSPCGEQRSENLRSFLKDVHLDVIYSTDYVRTKSTARPTANAKGLEIEQYDAQELKDFSQLLIDRQQDALVVGHSNTTGVLAGLLVGENRGAFDLDIYDRVYQVVVYKNKGRLHLLHVSMDCSE